MCLQCHLYKSLKALAMLHLILIRFTDSLNINVPNQLVSQHSSPAIMFNNNGKADCLNGYFALAFTVDDFDCLPSLTCTYPDMPDITISHRLPNLAL